LAQAAQAELCKALAVQAAILFFQPLLHQAVVVVVIGIPQVLMAEAVAVAVEKQMQALIPLVEQAQQIKVMLAVQDSGRLNQQRTQRLVVVVAQVL
jgi:hypothetical protein